MSMAFLWLFRSGFCPFRKLDVCGHHMLLKQIYVELPRLLSFLWISMCTILFWNANTLNIIPENPRFSCLYWRVFQRSFHLLKFEYISLDNIFLAYSHIGSLARTHVLLFGTLGNLSLRHDPSWQQFLLEIAYLNFWLYPIVKFMFIGRRDIVETINGDFLNRLVFHHVHRAVTDRELVTVKGILRIPAVYDGDLVVVSLQTYFLRVDLFLLPFFRNRYVETSLFSIKSTFRLLFDRLKMIRLRAILCKFRCA